MNINGIEVFVEKIQGTGNLSFVLIHKVFDQGLSLELKSCYLFKFNVLIGGSCKR
jgi:hypothetical protein